MYKNIKKHKSRSKLKAFTHSFIHQVTAEILQYKKTKMLN